jgi:RHS repeat-associated protein
VTTITNSSGANVQELSYDAWGNLRNPYTWSGSFTGTPKFDRGFTGHEHHSHFGLINMKFTLSERSAKLCLSTAERCELGGANGRMYDPLMCSFLSVDTYVQDPGNAQNFNRYAYCLNNPLRYVDPSGDFLTWSINQHGFSIGVNFTPAGVPLGVGINVSWANGGSIGLYAEAAYRVGSWGAGAQFSYDYSLACRKGMCSVSAFGSMSLGCFNLGASFGSNLNEKTIFWGLNAGVGFLCGDSNNSYGGGLSIGYGTGGLSYGVNGFYNRMQKPSTMVLSTVTVEGSDGLLPIGQDSDHGCLEAVYQWIAETYGMELTAKKKAQIAACVFQDSDGNWFLKSGNNYMDVIKTGHKAFDQQHYEQDMLGTIYDYIEDGGRIAVNLAPIEDRIGDHVYSIDDGHSIGIHSVSKIQRTNIFGVTTSGYSVRVMDPAMNGHYGGYRFISPYYIRTSQNISIFYSNSSLDF